MAIRRATIADYSNIDGPFTTNSLCAPLWSRPDLFQEKGVKYTEDELAALIADDNRPIFVYEDDNGKVIAHMFTIVEDVSAPRVPQKHSLLMICVWTKQRADKKKIGEKLYQFALKYAKEIGCYNLTLKRLECK